jgi:FecR protein
MNARSIVPSALAAAFLTAALAPDTADAQREGYTYLSYVQPDVSLISKAEDDAAARINMPVLSGDSLVTGVGSRAEAVLADGNVVRVDGYTDLRFERMASTYEADDDRDLLFLARGTVAVEVRDVTTRERALRLDTDDVTVLAASRALFRVDAGRRGTEIYVLSGRVEVAGRGGRAVVRAGEYAFVSGDSDVEVDVSASPRDRFARFVEERRDRTDSRNTTRYVSSDFSYDYDNASFEDWGAWAYSTTCGCTCWKPRVGAGWTPYSLGYWRWTPAGLTWVSSESWGWLPYHYGTWVFDELLGWMWCPGNDYSPAWVYWNYTPGWVGWCPIGTYSSWPPHSRRTRINVGGGHGPVYAHLRGRVAVSQIDPRGWNYVPAGRIAVRLDPARDIVRGDRVNFRPGEIGMIATTPLRFERSSNPAASIQEAIRRLPGSESVRPAPMNEGLTAVLRRERTLSPAAAEELKRTLVRAGQDPAYRQQAAEVPRRADRSAPAESWRQATDRGLARGTPQAETPVRREGAPATSRDPGMSRRLRDEGWRSPSSPAPAPIPRRVEADRPARHDDSGWRAPQPRVIERERSREAPPAREPAPAPREAPAVHRDAPPAAREAPQSAPAPAPQPAPQPAAPAAPQAR